MASLSFAEIKKKGATSVEFVPLKINWSKPTLDAKSPESFGKPNYDRKLFWGNITDALKAANIGDTEIMSLVHGGLVSNGSNESKGKPASQSFLERIFGRNETPNGHALLAVYVVGGTIHTFRLEGCNGLTAWIKAFCSNMGGRPVQLTARADGHSAGSFSRWEVISVDPVPWLVSAAPNEWTASSQKGQKQRLIDAAAKVAGAEIQSDLTQIAPLWQQLVTSQNGRPNSGASEADIVAFQKATGRELPEGLAALLRLSDGAQDVFGLGSLMSVKEITQSWQGWKKIFDDFTIEDLTDHYSSDNDRTVAFYTTPFWIPFVDDRTGNFIAIDLLPGPKGRKGQIIQFGADEQYITVVAEDIVAYLAGFVGELQIPR